MSDAQSNSSLVEDVDLPSTPPSERSQIENNESLRTIMEAAADLEEKRFLLDSHEKYTKLKNELEMVEKRKEFAKAEARLKAAKEHASGKLFQTPSNEKKENIEEVAPDTTQSSCPSKTITEKKERIEEVTANTSQSSCSSTPCSLEPPTLFPYNTSTPAFIPQSNRDADLVSALATAMNLSRIAIPEPPIFEGDPLKFIEWRSSFSTLVTQRGVPQNELIFYLKKYVAGEARQAIDGFFFSGTATAYHSAMKVLDERYGNAFIIQRAYRNRLDHWPKIQEKDAKGLQSFSDFLKAIKDAAGSIPGLSILDDAAENQRLVRKLPNWAVLRWNRKAQEILDRTSFYPTFSEFACFLEHEAKIANNPICSLMAIQNLEQPKHDNHKNIKVLATHVESKEENKENICQYCSIKNHNISTCFKFCALPYDSRRKYIKEKGLCYGCLRKGHLSKDCNSRLTCQTCKRNHPTSLHRNEENKVENSEPKEIAVSSKSTFKEQEPECTSMIVPVWISKPDSKDEILTYALLDTQSDSSYILESTASSIGLQGEEVKLSLSTMTAKDTKIISQQIKNIKIRGINTDKAIILNEAFTREFIPANRKQIPTRDTARRWSHLSELTEKLPILQSCDIGLLIGYNCPQALAPIRSISGSPDEPFAVETILGWSIVGYQGCSSGHRTFFSNRISVKVLPNIQTNDVIKALEGDFVHEKETVKISQLDIEFLEIMEKNVKIDETDHIEMPLPFKNRPKLPDNKFQAITRLQHLKKKLSVNKLYSDKYFDYMDKLLENDDAEKVEDNDPDFVIGNVWYLPHHGVFHPRKPGKLRVVFDCSASYKNETLNQHLLTGPDITNGLAGILCRFRRFPVAVMCDVERMFHQFNVPVEDRNFLRYLWWEDRDLDKKPATFRMKVHLFGAASSPGCANYGLKYLAESYSSQFPNAANFIKKEFYVDDGLMSLESADEAKQLMKDAKEICSSGGLKLHKFASNVPEVLDSISDEKSDTTVKSEEIEHALGIKWSLKDDSFFFDIEVEIKAQTRRSLLGIVASIFDPLGLLAPFLLIGKKILQSVCRKGISWDEDVPDNKKNFLEEWLTDLKGISKIKIPRCLVYTPSKDAVLELHHFADASSEGYGSATYLRVITDTVKCVLVMAKSRVAPLSIVTIPRLELTAAVLAVNISRFLEQELCLDIQREYFWTDSQVVLGYIHNDARRFHVFVANRVQQIRRHTKPDQWHYVPSEENPADHASRGLSVDALTSSSWFSGPAFLHEREIPLSYVEPKLKIGDPEVRAHSFATSTTKSESLDIENLLSRFSSWQTAVSVVARLKRISNGVKGTHLTSVEERRVAEMSIIRFVQLSSFSETIETLKKSGSISKDNPLYPLDPILKDNILCVGGRLTKSKCTSLFKNPAILPKNNHVTQLILSYAHEKVKHQGRTSTLNSLRQLGYHIAQGSKCVANFIKDCVMCRKLRRPAEVQRMSDLPQERVDPSPPFTYCGMDCFGPFTTTIGRKQFKRYGLLFTCMCSRAIHIEMLDDMTSDCFINALRSFIAIRGPVRQLRSDHGSNFIGANNEFKQLIKESTQFIQKQNCDFVFNAPDASHTGGVWERQIRTVRDILNAITQMCPGRLDDSSLRTLFYESMAIVNSRPLTTSDINDPSEMEPLTPNHILTSKSAVPLPPPGTFVREDLFLRKRWRRVQFLLEQFWARWKREYLVTISLPQKWKHTKRNIQIGDIVLIKDIDLPRNEWPMARVIDVTSDDKGFARRARVKLGKSEILERSIHKLVLLVEAKP